MANNQFISDTRKMMAELRPNLCERSARNIERKLKLASDILFRMRKENIIDSCEKTCYACYCHHFYR